jgi:hypothetical protein
VELGVIGCPNLGPEPAKIGEEVIPNGKGVLMVAVKGEGSYSVSHLAKPVQSNPKLICLSAHWTQKLIPNSNYLLHRLPQTH